MALPVINTKTFTFDTSLSPDSQKYVGASQTAVIKDHLILRRTAPKATKTSPGVSRTSTKRVITELVNGVYVDGISEHTTSIPVGFSAGGTTALRADQAAFLASTAGIALVDKATISF